MYVRSELFPFKDRVGYELSSLNYWDVGTIEIYMLKAR
jgi:hypothetical protein